MNAIYCRVSTDAQAETGYSLVDQLRACRCHATTLGLQSTEYIDDGYSGEYLERPALDRLRDALQAKLVQNLIIYDPDRLSRNLTNQLLLADEVEKAGCILHFVTGSYDASPEGRLFFSIRGAISAFEKAKIRERTMRGKRSKALSGKLTQNGRAYGYSWDKERSMYIIDENEATIVRLIYDLYLSRQISVRNLAIMLRQQQIMNRTGKHFTISHIHRILSDEKYAGTKWAFQNYDKKVSQYKRKRTTRTQEEWIPIAIPAIITPEQFQLSRQIMANNKHTAPRNTCHQYLLRGFIRCGVCGYAMSAHHKKQSSGSEYTWYKCTSGNTDKSLISCHNPALSCKKLDELIWDKLCTVAKTRKDTTILVQQPKISGYTEQIVQLTQHQEEFKKRQSTILRWFKDGIVAPNEAEKELIAIKKEIQATINAIKVTKEQLNKPATGSPEEILSAKTFTERRMIIENLGWRLYVDNRTTPIKLSFRP